MKSKHLGMGVILFEDVIEIDQKFLFEYIQWLKKNKENEFIYEEQDGITYAINKSGFKFNVEDIKQAPQRFIDLLGRQDNKICPKEYIDFVQLLEDTIYKCLVEYCVYFNDAATTSWWRPFGHIVSYESGQKIGPHCDDQIPYEWGKNVQNQTPIHNSSSINLYLNNSVDTEDELSQYSYIGGEIHFPNIPYIYKPKAGTALIYPSSYIGRHEVFPVFKGQRYAFLSNACYGSTIGEDGLETIGQGSYNKHWMPDLMEDLHKITNTSKHIKH